MGAQYESTVDHPVEEVLAWHSRPGAASRLLPPWHSIVAVEQARSLGEPRTVYRLRGGLRLIANRSRSDDTAPKRFVDDLSLDRPGPWPRGPVARGQHIHEFRAESSDQTTVYDHVDLRLPARLLRPVLTYRHRQLADDLAAHREAARAGATSLTVAITGASGLVGAALTDLLISGGHRVVRLVRGRPVSPDERQWNPLLPAPDLFEDVDAVVHLAGSPISGRFTDAHMAAIRDSRVAPTEALAKLAAQSGGPTTFVSASAVGFYGHDRGDEELTEQSRPGSGFLAQCCLDWEAAAQPAVEAGLRVVTVRTGVVQAANGGTLKQQRPLFAAGLGGRLGTGKQWFAWVSLDDVIDVYYRALYDRRLDGPVNAVAPQPVRNETYAKTLASVLHRPAVLPVPTLGPRMLLGEVGVRELAKADQRVLPAKLTALGHRFRQPELTVALAHQLGKS